MLKIIYLSKHHFSKNNKNNKNLLTDFKHKAMFCSVRLFSIRNLLLCLETV